MNSSLYQGEPTLILISSRCYSSSIPFKNAPAVKHHYLLHLKLFPFESRIQMVTSHVYIKFYPKKITRRVLWWGSNLSPHLYPSHILERYLHHNTYVNLILWYFKLIVSPGSIVKVGLVPNSSILIITTGIKL